MILADLEIGGRTRKVILQAPKNGYFWVIDRETGEFISAKPYVDVTWSDGVDPKTGKPHETTTADYAKGLALVKPTAFGGHNWQPMSFNPTTGLVYIPAQEILGGYRIDPAPMLTKEHFNTGTDMSVFATLTREIVAGHLLAWDPVEQKEVWRHPYAMPWNGGTLTTAGNLVFQGTADGRFIALRADDGRPLWEFHTGTGVIAAPITYSVDGVQYVTIVCGWGGAFGLVGGDAGSQSGLPSKGLVHTFALFNQPITPAMVEGLLSGRADAEAKREDLYHRWCSRCHGVTAISGGALADLRRSSPDVQDAFVEIVQKGMPGVGMPAFAGILDEAQIRDIQTYVKTRPH
jgi:quinohemoprotein ethanol dehydrogenase